MRLKFGVRACALHARTRAPNIFRWPSYPVFVIIIHVVIAHVLCVGLSAKSHVHIHTNAHTQTRKRAHTMCANY